jgi:hypothetical protein
MVRNGWLPGLVAVVTGSMIFSAAIPAQAYIATAARDPLAGLSADRIIARAEADLAAARSVREYSGTIANGVTRPFSDITYSGHACTESIYLFANSPNDYIQTSRAEWVLLTRQLMAGAGYSKAEIARYAGKWAVVDSWPPSSLGYVSCTSMGSAGLPGTGWTRGAVSTVAGQRAVRLTGTEATAWVSDSARPEFLKTLTTEPGGATGWTTFSRYNAHVTITPPPASDVVSPPPPPTG